MYKIASRNLQRRHAVDRPQATGGVLAAGEAFQPDVSHLSMSEAMAERTQVLARKTQDENRLACAKAEGNALLVRQIGAALAQHSHRLGALKDRIATLKSESFDIVGIWKQAMRDVVGEDAWQSVCARKDEIEAEIGAGK